MTITIYLKERWIYSDSGAHVTCVSKFVRRCNEKYGDIMRVVESNICACTLEFSQESGGLKAELKEILLDVGVPADRFDELCVMAVDGEEAAEARIENEKADADRAQKGKADAETQAAMLEKIDEFVKQMHQTIDEIGVDEEDDEEDEDGEDAFDKLFGTPKEAKKEEDDTPDEESVKEILSEINDLLGADEFKDFCNRLHERAERIRRHKTQAVLLSGVYCFFINQGQQFYTCVELLAKLLIAEKLLSDSARSKGGFTLSPYGRSAADQSAMENDIDRVSSLFRRAYLRMIDITPWAAHTDSELFKAFLKEISRANDKEGLIIFRCLPQTSSITKKMLADIQDLLPVSSVSIRDYTEEEFLTHAESILGRYGYRFAESAKPLFNKLLTAERADGSFYGRHTIEKVVNQLISAHESSEQPNEDEITVEDLGQVLDAPFASEEMSAKAMLAKVYGLESVKQQILDACRQILYAKKFGLDMPSFHMVFLGNPGTGKTTMARIVGQLLHEEGALRIGNFYEHKARDLCGEYIGQTARLTNEICSKAYGSVLFLDEAYSLSGGDKSDRDYGKEALATLLTEMENHASDFIVIFAGYTEEMQDFLNVNPGLKSRIPFHIRFPSYTSDELYHIFELMATTSKFKCSEELLKCAKDYFASIPDEVKNDRTFGNARYVRSIYERTWGNAASRAGHESNEIAELLPEDFRLAVERINAESEVTKSLKIAKIGF